jgi:hypothetical protein
MLKKVLGLTLFLAASTFAYSYTCFPPITEKGKIAINPVVFADDKNSGGLESFLYYGMTDKIDISTSILISGGTANFSVMLRHKIKSAILGVKTNPSFAIPQVSYDWGNDHFIFQTTVATQVIYDYSDKPAFYAVLCPGYNITKSINICIDLSPGYYLQEGDFANYAVRTKGFGFDIAPSVGFPIGDCQFSVAVPMYNLQKDAQVTFGAWLYFSR